jgi:tetratricopeptide (TPR) repeat protein
MSFSRIRGKVRVFSRNRILSLAGVLFFGLAALAALRLAVAETIFRGDSGEAIGRAIAVLGSTPAAAFEERLAEIDVPNARTDLARALAANPRSGAAWIALGLREESGGDHAAAEGSLLEASRVDRRYLPAWTLANFYFRRGNRPQFWVWANRAASVAYDDSRSLVRLADEFEPDPERMLAHFEDAPRLLPAYLDFLIGMNRLDKAQQVAKGMWNDRANDPLLIDLADRQVRAGNALAAIELWNAASGFTPIEPSAGRILTNGDLSRAPLNLGFDWRLVEMEGVREKWRPSELVFTLSGSEPEGGVLLEQTIYFVPRHFRLRFNYLTGAIPPSGMRWALDDIAGPPLEPSDRWREGVFDVPRTKGLADLKLIYRREPGTARTGRRIELRDLRLEDSP